MKILALFLCIITCSNGLFSCNKSQTKTSAVITKGAALSSALPQSKKPIKFFPIIDAQRNMVMGLLPIPANWEFSDDKENSVFLEGPDGEKLFYIQGNQFVYSQNPYIAQNLNELGFQIKPFEPIEYDVQTLKQAITGQGGKFLGQMDLPQFEKAAYAFEQQLFKATPEQKTIKVIGTEWEVSEGIKSFIIIQHYIAQTQVGYYWGYQVDIMEAPTKVYERARKDFLNAKLNLRMNNQWIATVNAENQRQSQQITEGHNQRMAALRQQGSQIIAAGKQHDAMTSRNHQKFMESLTDRITVTSPSTGQLYDVALGSNHYWINDQNQLITSDNANYNPNQSNYSSGNWEEAQINY